MTRVLESQHRLVYSLLKPAVRVASWFGLSFRILSDLLRLAYYEVLAIEQGRPNRDIARRFGQTERHMRSLARRIEEDFFSAERDVGLPREIEDFVAQEPASREAIRQRFEGWPPREVDRAIDDLCKDERIRLKDGLFTMSQRYVVLRSDQFAHRIDALNHFLDGATQAVLHRLVYDEADAAMIKTVSFTAHRPDLLQYVRRLEGDLRVELAAMDERAQFGGDEAERFTMSLTLAPRPATKAKER